MTNNRRYAPWQKIGSSHEHEEITSARQLMTSAGLDWTVSLNDLVAVTPDDVSLEVPNRFATVKETKDGTRTVLGTVGSRYNILQNQEVFESLDFLVDSGEARYSAAGELRNGNVVWAVMELPSSVKIADDPHAGYLLARTSHDGSTSFELCPIISRLSCTNQMNAAFSTAKGGLYSLKHTTNNRISISDIRSVINIMYEDFNTYTDMAESLTDQAMSDSEFQLFTKRVYSLPSIIEFSSDDTLSASQKRVRSAVYKNRDNAWSVWTNQTGTQEHLRGTKFGALHAIIEVADHFSKSYDKTSAKILLSKDGNVKQKALQLLA